MPFLFVQLETKKMCRVHELGAAAARCGQGDRIHDTEVI